MEVPGGIVDNGNKPRKDKKVKTDLKAAPAAKILNGAYEVDLPNGFEKVSTGDDEGDNKEDENGTDKLPSKGKDKFKLKQKKSENAQSSEGGRPVPEVDEETGESQKGSNAKDYISFQLVSEFCGGTFLRVTENGLSVYSCGKNTLHLVSEDNSGDVIEVKYRLPQRELDRILNSLKESS